MTVPLAALDARYAPASTGRVKAYRSSLLVGAGLVSWVGGANEGAWVLFPAATRLTIPAAAGDLLCYTVTLFAQGGSAELDACCVLAGVPARYASTGTAAPQAVPVGCGGLYKYGAGAGVFDGDSMSLPWVVAAADLDVAGNITMSLLYHTDSPLRQWQYSDTYPGLISLVNYGPGTQ